MCEQLPWVDSPLSHESSKIVENLRWLNYNGFFTINRSGEVCGGWGGMAWACASNCLIPRARAQRASAQTARQRVCFSFALFPNGPPPPWGAWPWCAPRRVACGDVPNPQCRASALTPAVPAHARACGFLRHGVPLTRPVRSQPKINAVSSSDPDVGWGGAGGYVFQKAYVEFFVSPALFDRLLPAFERHPTLTYHAVNASGAFARGYSEGSEVLCSWFIPALPHCLGGGGASGLDACDE
jgi:hypothetical protein